MEVTASETKGLALPAVPRLPLPEPGEEIVQQSRDAVTRTPEGRKSLLRVRLETVRAAFNATKPRRLHHGGRMHRSCLKGELYPFLHLRVVRSPEKNREDDQATPVAQRGCGWEICRKGSLCRTIVYVDRNIDKHFRSVRWRAESVWHTIARPG